VNIFCPQKYERCFNTLQNLISGLSEKEAQNALNNAVCKDKNHEEVSLGLLFVILTDPQSAAKVHINIYLTPLPVGYYIGISNEMGN
jgi:integrator complex subunit 3